MRNWQKWWIVIVLLLLVSLLTWPVAGQGGGGLDLVLLVDSSGSTADTDPGGLRVSAARFLLDYVQAVGEAQGVTHRFAAANFNTSTLDEIPFTPLQGDAGRDQLVARSQGATDFGPALAYALRVRQESGGADKAAIVLFTDGTPCPTTPCLQGAALTAYFSNLKSTIAALQDSGTQIFVVALGDNSTAENWVGLVGAANYRFVDANTDLAGVYHDFLAGLLGLGSEAVRPLADGGATEITVEPYLEQLVISIVKVDTRTQVTVTDPFGGMPLPTRGGGNTLHVVYAVPSPVAGSWKVRVTGGMAQVWVDRQYAALALDASTAPHALGAPLDVTGQLLRRGIVIRDDPDLRLSVTATDSNNAATAFDLARKSDGRYQGALTGLTAEGAYTLTLSGAWSGQPVGARQTGVVTVSVFAVPVMGIPEIQGNMLIGAPITVTVPVSQAERIGPATEIFARLLRTDGSTVETPALRDDGQAPDTTASDGVYAAALTLPAVEGRYRVEAVLQGLSRDGVALNAFTPQQVINAGISLPTPTTTPAVTPTIVPPETPDQPGFDVPNLGRRYPWLGIGVVLGGLLVAIYLVARYKPQLTKIKEKYDALAQQTRWKEVEEKSEESQKAFSQGDISQGVQFLREGLDIIAEIETKIVGKAFAEARDLFEFALPTLREKKCTEEYENIISDYANSPRYSIVRALAEGLVRNPDCTPRPTEEVIMELYHYFGNGTSKDYSLLRAMSEIKNAPIASLCALIYQAQIDPEPDYSEIIRGIDHHLGEKGRGLKSTYQLIEFLAQRLFDTELNASCEKAIDETQAGPLALHNALKDLRQYLYLEPGVQNKEWYERQAILFARGIDSLRHSVSQKGLPELRLLMNYLERWRAYADVLTIGALDARKNLTLEIRPSLSLRILERVDDPYYYEEVNEKGRWLIKAPVVVHNHGGIPVANPIIVVADGKESVILEPKEFTIPSLLPYAAECQDFGVRAVHIGNVTFNISGSDLDQNDAHTAILTVSYYEKGGDETKEKLLGPTQNMLEEVCRQLREALEQSQIKPEQRAIFLHVMPGAGRSEALGWIARQLGNDHTVIGFLNIAEKIEEATLQQWAWHTLLAQVQQQTGSQLPIPEPEHLIADRIKNQLGEMLGTRKMIVIIDGTDGLPNSAESWFALEMITTVFGGAMVSVCGRVRQPWEQWFWQGPIATDRKWEIDLLDEEDSYVLVRRVIADNRRTLTELAHKGIWIYSGGHAGFITTLCQKLPFTDTDTLLGLDAVKQAVQAIKSDSNVQRWYYHFSTEERCVLDVLARGGFVQEDTGLLRGVRRPQNGAGLSWDPNGMEKLQAMVSRRYPDASGEKWRPENLERILGGFVTQQVIEPFERQVSYGTLRWRMGWIYIMAHQVRVDYSPSKR